MGRPLIYRSLNLVLLTSMLISCAQEESFSPLDLNVSGPIDVAVDKTGAYFYALNSDYAREYNRGSILVVQEDGERIASVDTPRLGRHLNVAGDIMLAGFGNTDDKSKPSLWLLSLEDPKAPKLIKTFELDCIPLNAAVYADYKYFALSCGGGRLYIGQLAEDLANSELTLVRAYGRERRALHIDTKEQLLFAFTTQMGERELADIQAEDIKRFDSETGELVEGSNEVPDIFESTTIQRRQSARRQAYQFVVYDLAAEAEAGFPYRAEDDAAKASRDIVTKELRWLYFTLKDLDGTPDTDAGIRDRTINHYRSNFWTAKADPESANAFFVSQRSTPNATYNISNNVIRVELIGDPRVTAEGQVPRTDSFFAFERVYGHASELDLATKLHYTGDFVVGQVNGQQTLLVNHFRDLSTFNPGERRFSIAAKVLGNSFWLDEIKATDPVNSFYQLAMNQRGVVFSCAFYGDALIRLEVQPGTGITEPKRIQ